MAAKINWGIIGTGSIASCVAQSMAATRTGQLLAVASRAAEKSKEFGRKFNISPEKCYGDYESLIADKEVHAVYIATPHPFHGEWAIKAAAAGKHLLIEKPVGVNQYDAQAIFEAARAHNVFAMEAFMYRCHPQTAKLVELLKAKIIGDVRVIQATFSFQAGFNPGSRIYSNELAGGGILDVGCYAVSIARLIAGTALGKDFADPIEVKAVGHLEATGVDGYTVGVLKFPGDIVAQVSTGVAVNQENVVRVFGTEGNIFIAEPWIADRKNPNTGTILVKRNDAKDAQKFVLETMFTSFTLELDVVGDAIAAGKKQADPPAMTWADTLSNMRTLDAWRSQIGLTYSFEKPENFSSLTIGEVVWLFISQAG